MKSHSRIRGAHILGAMLAAGAVFSLAGCTYYHTTERQAAAQAPRTVVVPRAEAPRTVVVPKAEADSETVVVEPDSTVTVRPKN